MVPSPDAKHCSLEEVREVYWVRGVCCNCDCISGNEPFLVQGLRMLLFWILFSGSSNRAKQSECEEQTIIGEYPGF